MFPMHPLLAVVARGLILFLLGLRPAPVGARRLGLELTLAIVLLYGTFQLGGLLADGYRNPREWDFPAFYLDAVVGASGMNVHEPDSFRAIAPTVEIPVALGDEFADEITNVGFLYPTPTMFLLLPMGFLEFHTAHAMWIAFLAVGLILAMICTWRWIDDKRSSQSLLLVGVLLVYFGPTWQTAEFEQTNYLNLALIALFLGSTNDRTRGLVAGLGPFVKPLMGFLLIGLILERRWRAVSTAIVAAVAAFGLAGLAFGFDSVGSYFLSPPNGRLPPWVYTQDVNQSLLAEILRATHETDSSRIGSGNPIFLVAALVLALPTVLVAGHLLSRGLRQGYALLLMLALLLYPSSLMHYAVLTIVPVLFLLKACESKTCLLLASAAGAAVLTLLDFSVLLSDLLLWQISLLVSLATVLTYTRTSLRAA